MMVLRVRKVTLNLENKNGDQEHIQIYFGATPNKLRLLDF